MDLLSSDAVVAVLVCLAVIPAVGFPVLYSFFDWRAHPAGRSAMTLALVIAVTLTLRLVQLAGGRLPEWTRALVWLGISSALWYQFLTLIRGNARRRSNAADLRDEQARDG